MLKMMTFIADLSWSKQKDSLWFDCQSWWCGKLDILCDAYARFVLILLELEFNILEKVIFAFLSSPLIIVIWSALNIADFEHVISHHIQHDDFHAALDVLTKQVIGVERFSIEHRKVNCVCFGFALLRSVIGQQNSRHFFNQLKPKPNPAATFPHVFSRALRHRLHVIASYSDWLIALSRSVVIGSSNCFGFGVTTLNW